MNTTTAHNQSAPDIGHPCAGKKCYATKKAAQTAINHRMIGRGRHKGHRPERLRSYYCYACEAHHLTHH